jgi:hypothetical protein
MSDPKIIDILSKKSCEDDKPLVSLEYFPPRTEDGVKVRRQGRTSFDKTILLVQKSHMLAIV